MAEDRGEFCRCGKTSQPAGFESPKEKMAEDRGFEPLKPFSLHAFQACALDHYANPPYWFSGSIEKISFFAKWIQKTLSQESAYFTMVTPRRVELRFTGWKPAVLTARRWGQKIVERFFSAKSKVKKAKLRICKNGREDKTRTCNPRVPNAVR